MIMIKLIVCNKKYTKMSNYSKTLKKIIMTRKLRKKTIVSLSCFVYPLMLSYNVALFKKL